MATLEQFKMVRASVPPKVQIDIYGLIMQDLDAAVEGMISIGVKNGIIFTPEETLYYLKVLYEKGMLDDITTNNLELISRRLHLSSSVESIAKCRASRKRLWNSRTRHLARGVNILARVNILNFAYGIRTKVSYSRKWGTHTVSFS